MLIEADARRFITDAI